MRFTFNFAGFESSPVVCPCDYVLDFGTLGTPLEAATNIIKSANVLEFPGFVLREIVWEYSLDLSLLDGLHEKAHEITMTATVRNTGV